jgi:hypothetical protein
MAATIKEPRGFPGEISAKEFTCRYQPGIGSSGKEPDFLLFGKNLGLLLLECDKEEETSH